MGDRLRFFKEIVSFKTGLLRKLQVLLRLIRLELSGAPLVGDMMDVPPQVRGAWGSFTGGIGWAGEAVTVDPDAEFDALKEPVMNPVVAFNEAIAAGPDHADLPQDNPFKGRSVEVDEAFLFEAHFDERGRMARDGKVLEILNHGWPAPHLIRHVVGNDAYRRRLSESKRAHGDQPERSKRAREAAAVRTAASKKLVEDGFLDTALPGFGPNLQFDPNQYTEFAPSYGGPFFKQLYLFDYLRQHAYAFEAWNHNPLAKRIVNLVSQYTLGRRFTLRVRDAKKQAAWDAADEKHGITDKLSEFWANEANIYGELFVDVESWQSVDPSTIWDIITDPDDIDDEYYMYQSYPTAYQQFTGYQIPGVPGAENQPAQKYIVRQIPAFKLLHLKLNCVSNEKRGRSLLFPILGWMKRIKDLYNAQVIRQWLLSCFIWDVTVDGSQADVDAYASAYSQIPNPASLHVHNKTVERKPMAAIESQGTARGGGSVAEELLSFIAMAVGVPKEFLNVVTYGAASRATALVSSEPFTKVIEDMQARWETFIKEIFRRVMEQSGMDYAAGDVEVLFPSVTKDTTSETIKNLQQCEAMGWFDKRMCAEMAAKEMNVTEFDFEEVQKRIRDLERSGMNRVGVTPLPGAGRFGGGAGGDGVGGSPIHGNGKVELRDQLNDL